MDFENIFAKSDHFIFNIRVNLNTKSGFLTAMYTTNIRSSQILAMTVA